MKLSKMYFLLALVSFIMISCVTEPPIPQANYDLGKEDLIKSMTDNLIYDPYGDTVWFPKDENVMTKIYQNYISKTYSGPEFQISNISSRVGGYFCGAYHNIENIQEGDTKEIDGLKYFNGSTVLWNIDKGRYENDDGIITTYNRVAKVVSDSTSNKNSIDNAIRHLFQYGWIIVRNGPVTTKEDFQGYIVPLNIIVLTSESNYLPPTTKVLVFAAELKYKDIKNTQSKDSKKTIEERMNELKKMLDDGIISSEEYQDKRTKLINEL